MTSVTKIIVKKSNGCDEVKSTAILAVSIHNIDAYVEDNEIHKVTPRAPQEGKSCFRLSSNKSGKATDSVAIKLTRLFLIEVMYKSVFFFLWPGEVTFYVRAE